MSKKLFFNESERIDFCVELGETCYVFIRDMPGFGFRTRDIFVTKIMDWIKNKIRRYPGNTIKVSVYYALSALFFDICHIFAAIETGTVKNPEQIIAQYLFMYADQISYMLMGRPDKLITNMNIIK